MAVEYDRKPELNENPVRLVKKAPLKQARKPGRK